MPNHTHLNYVLAAFIAGCGHESAPPPSPIWRAVWMSDTHVIGHDYTCCENGSLDTTSIYKTRTRLAYAVDEINALSPMPQQVFIAGDIFHDTYNHGGSDVSAYVGTESAASEAKTILDGFKPDVALAWGNHDYSVPGITRDFSHQLFKTLFDTEPYYAVNRGGFRFLIMNSMLGETWNPDNAAEFNREVGSFGADQLAWAAKQLDDGVPTFLVFHYHPLAGTLAHDEVDGPIGDIFDLVRTYQDVVQAVFMGHLHRWIDTPMVKLLGLKDTDVGEVPFFILGGLRYDAGNYWVMELDSDKGTWELLDRDKAAWNTTWAYDERWTKAGAPIIDKTAHPAAYDPATDGSDLDDPVDTGDPPTP